MVYALGEETYNRFLDGHTPHGSNSSKMCCVWLGHNCYVDGGLVLHILVLVADTSALVYCYTLGSLARAAGISIDADFVG